MMDIPPRKPIGYYDGIIQRTKSRESWAIQRVLPFRT